MLLDDIKSLIKDFEKCLMKEPRFKKDCGFKNEVKIIYKFKKTPNHIIVPVPYYTGTKESNTVANTVQGPSTTGKPCPKCGEIDCSKCGASYEESDLNTFIPESDNLHKYVNALRGVKESYSEEDEERLYQETLEAERKRLENIGRR
jgi:hypothetical protein